MHIFASQLHTHLTGKRVFTKHYRNGSELPEVNRDNHYSPHYQEIRKLHRPVTVLPVCRILVNVYIHAVNIAKIIICKYSYTNSLHSIQSPYLNTDFKVIMI